MSFIRFGKYHSSAAAPRKKKLKPRRKPVWDDTIHDLNPLKATDEELIARRSSHQSKHALSVQLAKIKQVAEEKSREKGRSESCGHKVAILKEVLYDQQQFQDVLAKSDKMMNVVKDMFGDDPKRFTGFPVVTAAPNSDDPNISLVAPLPDIPSRLQALSDSVMNASALNDLPGSDSDEMEVPTPIHFESRINIDRFQQFLAAEENNHSVSTISGQAQLSQYGLGPGQSTQIQDSTAGNVFETPKRDANESISILRSPQSAINDTRKVKKTKKRVVDTQQNNPPSNLNLTDLRKVLEGLEDEVAEYERQMGRSAPAERGRQDTFSGYTLTLVDTVAKLTRYLRENDLRLKAEMIVREHLAQDVLQLKALIDALTSDIILTQEEYTKLHMEFEKYKQTTVGDVAQIKIALQELGVLKTVPAQDISNNATQTPPKVTVRKETPSVITCGVEFHQPQLESVKALEAAVLLSPPVRKSRLSDKERQSDHQIDIPDNVMPSQLLQENECTLDHARDNHAADIGYITTCEQQSSVEPRSSESSRLDLPHQQIPIVLDQSIVHSGLKQQTNVPLVHGTVQMHPPPASVRVPRPTPLVQYNNSTVPSDPASRPSLPAYSETQNTAVTQRNGNVQRQQGFGREFLANQIALLNEQHEEAQRRLSSLMNNNQSQEKLKTLQDMQVQAEKQKLQQQQQILQRQQQEQRQQILQKQQQIQKQQQEQRQQYEQQQVLQRPEEQLQRQQYEQQRVLQRPEEQLQRQQYEQQQVLQRPEEQLQRQHEQHRRQQQILYSQQQQQHQQVQRQQVSSQQSQSRQDWSYLGQQMSVTTEKPRQVGLPAYPVSPPISPISLFSDQFTNRIAANNSNLSEGTSRGITISIPQMDLSNTSSLSPHTITAVH